MTFEETIDLNPFIEKATLEIQIDGCEPETILQYLVISNGSCIKTIYPRA